MKVEINHLEYLFPHFIICPIRPKGYQVILNPPKNTRSQYLAEEIDELMLIKLIREHAALAIQKVYHELYPNLWFTIDIETLKPKWVWIRSKTREEDGTATSFLTADLQDHDKLRNINAFAKLARRPNWFWCTNCSQPYPQEDHGYSQMAGEFCKKCKEENPKAYEYAKSLGFR